MVIMFFLGFFPKCKIGNNLILILQLFMRVILTLFKVTGVNFVMTLWSMVRLHISPLSITTPRGAVTWQLWLTTYTFKYFPHTHRYPFIELYTPRWKEAIETKDSNSEPYDLESSTSSTQPLHSHGYIP